jgi:transmembrane sensor
MKNKKDKPLHLIRQNSEQSSRFSPEHEDHKEIWNLADEFRTRAEMDESEIEDALERVHNRLDFGRKATPSVNNGSRENRWLIARYLVAATALIIFGGYLLFVPVTITVPHGEVATVELRDGSTVELNSGTSLSYNRIFFGRTDRNITMNGEAFFSVASGNETFRVEANNTTTEVLGTEFNIRSWSSDPGSETTVTVSSGEVLFSAGLETPKPVTLTAGNLSRWNLEMDAPSTPGSIDPVDIAGWRDRRLIFRDQPLISILRELERTYDIRIDLEVPGAESETLTAYYARPVTAASILDDITLVKDLRYAETANGYRIFR